MCSLAAIYLFLHFSHQKPPLFLKKIVFVVTTLFLIGARTLFSGFVLQVFLTTKQIENVIPLLVLSFFFFYHKDVCKERHIHLPIFLFFSSFL